MHFAPDCRILSYSSNCCGDMIIIEYKLAASAILEVYRSNLLPSVLFETPFSYFCQIRSTQL